MVSVTAGSGLTGRRQLIRDNYFAGLLPHSKMVDPVQQVWMAQDGMYRGGENLYHLTLLVSMNVCHEVSRGWYK